MERLRDDAPAPIELDHRDVLGRAAILGGITLVSRVFAFLAIIAATKHFGAEGLGAVGFAQQLAVIAVTAGALGLDTYAIRAAVRSPDRTASIAVGVVALRLALGTPIFAGLVAASGLIPALRDVRELLLLFGLSIFSGAFSLLWLPQALHRSHVFGFTHLAGQVIYLGGVLIGIGLDAGLWIVPAAFVSGEVVGTIGLGLWSRRQLGRFGSPMPPREAIAFLRQAAPIGGAQLLRAVSTGSDLALAGMMLSLQEVGWYTGAFKVYLLGSTAVTLYFVVLFPHLAALAEGPRAALRRALTASTLRLAAFCIPGAAVGIGIAGWLLALLYDASFHNATAAFRVLIGVLLIVALNGHVRHALVALDRQRRDLVNVGVSCGFHVASKLLLVPSLGMLGAALGTLLGESLLLVLGLLSLRPLLRDGASPAAGDTC